ncbi:MAG: hypothetical protein Q9190_005517 [Brigantiaea leucoxantha]
MRFKSIRRIYHSIHARGERVEDVLRQAQEAEDTASDRNGDCQAEGMLRPNGVRHEILEDGELEDDEADESPENDGVVEHVEEEVASEQPTNSTLPANTDSNEQVSQPMLSMPQVALNNVQDEALKHLMMSWYYAGYYTGLYEGKQQATASMTTAPLEHQHG